jgi:hypothetical protein
LPGEAKHSFLGKGASNPAPGTGSASHCGIGTTCRLGAANPGWSWIQYGRIRGDGYPQSEVPRHILLALRPAKYFQGECLQPTRYGEGTDGHERLQKAR